MGLFDSLGWTEVLGLGGDVAGGLFGTSSAKSQNKAAAREAELSRQFTREQMQNRHQWEVNDLRAAGLNPILSAGGTPSMGGSNMAPVVGELDSAANSARDASKRILERKMAKQDLKTNMAMAGKLGMEAVAADSIAHKNRADEEFTKVQTNLLQKFGSAEAISRIIANGGSGLGSILRGGSSAKDAWKPAERQTRSRNQSENFHYKGN